MKCLYLRQDISLYVQIYFHNLSGVLLFFLNLSGSCYLALTYLIFIMQPRLVLNRWQSSSLSLPNNGMTTMPSIICLLTVAVCWFSKGSHFKVI